MKVDIITILHLFFFSIILTGKRNPQRNIIYVDFDNFSKTISKCVMIRKVFLGNV